MKPTHTEESNLLYSKSTALNINLIQKHLNRNIQNNVWLISWYHDPDKLTQNRPSHWLAFVTLATRGPQHQGSGLVSVLSVQLCCTPWGSSSPAVSSSEEGILFERENVAYCWVSTRSASMDNISERANAISNLIIYNYGNRTQYYLKILSPYILKFGNILYVSLINWKGIVYFRLLIYRY